MARRLAIGVVGARGQVLGLIAAVRGLMVLRAHGVGRVGLGILIGIVRTMRVSGFGVGVARSMLLLVARGDVDRRVGTSAADSLSGGAVFVGVGVGTVRFSDKGREESVTHISQCDATSLYGRLGDETLTRWSTVRAHPRAHSSRSPPCAQRGLERSRSRRG